MENKETCMNAKEALTTHLKTKPLTFGDVWGMFGEGLGDMFGGLLGRLRGHFRGLWGCVGEGFSELFSDEKNCKKPM